MDFRFAAGLFLVLACLSSGHTSSIDEETVFRTAEAWCDGRIDLDPPPDRGLNIARGVGGKFYSYYPPGGSVLILPCVVAGRILDGPLPLGPYGKRAFALFTPILLVALFLGHWRARFEAPREAALLFVFGTLLGVWDRTLQPLVPLALLVTWTWLHREEIGPLGLGAILGAATLLRYDAGIWFAGFFFRTVRTPRDLLRFLAGFLPALFFLAGYNHLRFGAPWRLGAPDVQGGFGKIFSGGLGTGLYGLLFSPSRSVFLYAPLSLAAGCFLVKTRPRERVLLAATILPSLLWYGLNPVWHAGPGWGPRYLLPGLTLLSLGLAEVPLATARWPRPLAAVAVGMGLLGTLASVDFHFDRLLESSTPIDDIYLRWENAPPLGQIHTLSNLRWNRPDLPPGWIPGGGGHPWAADLRYSLDLWPVYVWKMGRSPYWFALWGLFLLGGAALLRRRAP